MFFIVNTKKYLINGLALEWFHSSQTGSRGIVGVRGNGAEFSPLARLAFFGIIPLTLPL
ncbi:hypothetical protein [Orrella dioscoreae]|uniref:hypothetical protein n=1 Tax=Orrella dioscoreae TaxID=1851544 RepID=UPI0012FFF50F|nr:hypothetical protein [Orrella dioscoreae]